MLMLMLIASASLGGNMPKRVGGIIGCKDQNLFIALNYSMLRLGRRMDSSSGVGSVDRDS